MKKLLVRTGTWKYYNWKQNSLIKQVEYKDGL